MRRNYYHSNYGGAREGAGRPVIGVTQKVSITLTENEWGWVFGQQMKKHVKSKSELFRLLVQAAMRGEE